MSHVTFCELLVSVIIYLLLLSLDLLTETKAMKIIFSFKMCLWNTKTTSSVSHLTRLLGSEPTIHHRGEEIAVAQRRRRQQTNNTHHSHCLCETPSSMTSHCAQPSVCE